VDEPGPHDPPTDGRDYLYSACHVVQFAIADKNGLIRPRRSSSVCGLMAALVDRNGAQLNRPKHYALPADSDGKPNHRDATKTPTQESGQGFAVGRHRCD
jgi:hypothetical protein